MTEQLIIYFAVLNLATLTLSIIDTALVTHRIYQMPEKVFLWLSFIGGAAGAKFAQIVVRRRTFRLDFIINLNLIIMLQLFAALAIWSYQITSKQPVQNGSVLQSWMGSNDDKPEGPRRFGPGSP